MNLEAYLKNKIAKHEMNSSSAFHTALAEGKFFLFYIKKIIRPGMNTTIQTLTSLFFWFWVNAVFPIFSWSDLLGKAQFLFIFQIILQLTLEALRAHSREIRREDRAQRSQLEAHSLLPILLFSCIPLLCLGIDLSLHLHRAGRYFGVYDAVLLILGLRIPLSNYPKIFQAIHSPRRRLPFYWYLTLAPSFGMLFTFGATLRTLGTYALPTALLLEAILSFILQWRRISLNLEARPSPQAGRRISIHKWGELAFTSLQRLPSAIPGIAYHFWLGKEIFNGTLTPEQAIAIHAISPFTSLIVRSPWLFWKELWDHLTSPAVWLKMEVPGVLLSILGGIASLILPQLFPGDSSALREWIGCILILPWIHLRVMRLAFLGENPLLKIDAFLVLGLIFHPEWACSLILISYILRSRIATRQWKLPSENSFQKMQVRKDFWRPHHRIPALAEIQSMGGQYQVEGKYLYLNSKDSGINDWQLWSRGWFWPAKTQTAQENRDRTKYEQPEFNLQSLKWNRTGIDSIRTEDRALLVKRFLRLKPNSAGLGRVSVPENEFHWSNHQGKIQVSVKPR